MVRVLHLGTLPCPCPEAARGPRGLDDPTDAGPPCDHGARISGNQAPEFSEPTAGGDIILRPLLASDRAALRTATLANMNWAGDERFTYGDIDEAPELRHYFDFRPDRGDFGFVAEEVGAVIGVVWLLFLAAEDPGYGFVGEGIPELSLSVWPGYRGRGVGERLMRQALAEARHRGLERVSLSVEPANPALHLYRKLGFIPVKGGADGTHALEL